MRPPAQSPPLPPEACPASDPVQPEASPPALHSDDGKTHDRPGPRTRGPSPEKTAHTRAQILSAAMSEFMDHGFSASTMTRIAARAGLAKGTPYRYFESKEALFLDLLREIVTDPLRTANQEPVRPDETIRSYCQRTLVPMMAVIEHSGRANVARLVLTEARAFPELAVTYRRDVYLPFIGHLQSLIESAVARGETSSRCAAQGAYLLAAPLWVGLVHNGTLNPEASLEIASLFELQLDLVFGPLPG